MLYTETVESGTLELLKTLMQDSKFSDFLLAGGTNFEKTDVREKDTVMGFIDNIKNDKVRKQNF